MIVATCIVFLGACLLHQSSAQQNWWENGPDGSTTIATSRTTAAELTQAPPMPTTVKSTQAPPMPTTAEPTQTPSTTTNCPCVRTPEYNPICGDDGVTYFNPGMLECAQNCGQRVQLLFHGRCKKLR